jgi:hypothetical protein
MTSFLANTREQSSHRFLSGSTVSPYRTSKTFLACSRRAAQSPAAVFSVAGLSRPLQLNHRQLCDRGHDRHRDHGDAAAGGDTQTKLAATFVAPPL